MVMRPEPQSRRTTEDFDVFLHPDNRHRQVTIILINHNENVSNHLFTETTEEKIFNKLYSS